LVITTFALEVAMIKQLTKIGNSLGLIIDRPILELLKIDRETQLEISTDGKGLVIRPVEASRDARVRSSAERVAADHAEAFEKLAR
jgi:antitoxin component of MazEF toxin-antitoxin module